MDNRGVTPVVEKLLTIGIVVLFIGAVTAVLFGSAVPNYRTAVGAELGDRVLVSAGEQLEATVPPSGTVVTARTTIDIPETIRGESYVIAANGDQLDLEHPNPAIASEIRLSLPDRVSVVTGSIRSEGSRTVSIERTDAGVTVKLGDSA